MARKSGPTISQEELYPLADEPGREEAQDARLLDLDVEQEPPFLRVQKRVSVRRGSLPKKTVTRLTWAAVALGIVFALVFAFVAVTVGLYIKNSQARTQLLGRAIAGVPAEPRGRFSMEDIEQKVGRTVGVLEEMKETVEIYKDTDFIISSDRTSNVLNILTILFTLTIPATLVSSIYGMNIPLPGGLVTGPLDWFGPYTSLIVLFIAMIIPAIIMLLYFKRVGWF